ncbi:CotH kinase family protein [Melittangium boletus]|uniref:CotH kinase family protein n=1 Tax=Melittangium boletus TaxID=83453 RepID=UPI003DA39E68
MSAKRNAVVLAMLGGGLAAPVALAEDKAPVAPLTAEQLFARTTPWSAHLRFTPEQWKALEPKTLRDPKEMMRHFTPGRMLSGRIVADADGDKSGTLSKAELQALSERWFTLWDEEKQGALSPQNLRDGLNDLFELKSMSPKEGGEETRADDMASMMGVQFETTHADLEFEGQTFKNVELRYKGNFSYMQSHKDLKRSLKVDLEGLPQDARLGGLEKINFHSNVTDTSWMNEVLSHRLYREAGVVAPRTTYARVSITVPGVYTRQYVGLYSVVENIDSVFERMHYRDEAGALFKPVLPDLFADLGDDWAAYEKVYYPKGKVTEKQRARLIAFSKWVNQASDKDFAAKISQYIDLDGFARYMAATVSLSTMDSPLALGHNFYVHLDSRTQKFSIIPWDLDHSFGQLNMFTNKLMEELSIAKPWQGEKRFFSRLFQTPAFQKLYRARLAELQKGPFKPERVKALVDETAAAIRPAVKDESEEKLARFEKLVAGERVDQLPLRTPGSEEAAERFKAMGQKAGAEGAAPPQTPFGNEQVRPIKPFIEARGRSITAQLAGKEPGMVIKHAPMGPGLFFGPMIVPALDTNKDGRISRDELVQGFGRWYDASPEAAGGALKPEQLQVGIDKSLFPMPPPKAAATQGE